MANDVLPSVYGDGGYQEAKPVIQVGENGLPVSGEGFVTFARQGVIADGFSMLIDLNDNDGFPHAGSSGVQLGAVYLQIDKTNSSTGSVIGGVITRIDETDADVLIVQGVTFNNASDRQITRDRNYAPHAIDLTVTGGQVTHVASSGLAENVTSFNTLTPIDTPIGTAIPSVGDIVLIWAHSAGTYDFAVSAFYTSRD